MAGNRGVAMVTDDFVYYFVPNKFVVWVALTRVNERE